MLREIDNYESVVANRIDRARSNEITGQECYGNRSRTIWETKFQLPNRIPDFEIRRHCLQEILLSGYFLNLLPENGGEKEKFGGRAISPRKLSRRKVSVKKVIRMF